MRQQSRQPDGGLVAEKRAILMKYLLEKGELENNSRHDRKRAKGQRKSTMDQKRKNASSNSG
jgi:hypothetical protein